MIWGAVYIITIPFTNKCYVGSTQRNPEVRFKEHLTQRMVSKMRHLPYHAYKSFQFQVIEQGFFYDECELYDREDYYMKKYDTITNGYNYALNKRSRGVQEQRNYQEYLNALG